jgi:DNA recombination protein RmuC
VTDILLIVAVVLLLAVLAVLTTQGKKSAQPDTAAVTSRLDAFEKAQERTERAVREEVAQSREELAKSASELRQEVVTTLTRISDTMAKTITDLGTAENKQLETFSQQIAALTKTSGDKLDGMRTEATAAAKETREEITAALARLSDSNQVKLEAVRTTVEGKLDSIQSDNARRLEEMRQTVDEKLQSTLEKRLGESFRLVSERLEQVHKGLGEMQSLASGVGDLKRVLTNVKSRGTWGEVQLGALLEQVLTPDQFATNVATKDGGERVEYAIRLPGPGKDKDETVWLPIDAKFPIEDYLRLTEAQERADGASVEAAGRQLEVSVRNCANDIRDKYLNPPKTTDFGILFVPTEGLFAEVIRRAGLTDALQRDCRVVVAGPTTLWSLLNSLQMGFRTLAIEKRSSEVWTLLGAVKTEWEKYGDVLDAVQKKLHQASDTIEKAKVRSRAVGRKLKDVQALPSGDAAKLLPPDDGAALDGEDPENDATWAPEGPVHN